MHPGDKVVFQCVIPTIFTKRTISFRYLSERAYHSGRVGEFFAILIAGIDLSVGSISCPLPE